MRECLTARREYHNNNQNNKHVKANVMQRLTHDRPTTAAIASIMSPLSMVVSLGNLNMLKAWKAALKTTHCNLLRVFLYQPCRFRGAEETLLEVACISKRRDMAKWLVLQGMSRVDNSSAIAIALSNQHFLLARWLFWKAGYKLDIQEASGRWWTLLQTLFFECDLDLIEWFVDRAYKADPTLMRESPHTWTNLMDEMVENQKTTDLAKKIRWLLSQKERIHFDRTSEGVERSLMTAVVYNRDDIVAIFAEFGAELPEKYNRDHPTIKHIARRLQKIQKEAAKPDFVILKFF